MRLTHNFMKILLPYHRLGISSRILLPFLLVIGLSPWTLGGDLTDQPKGAWTATGSMEDERWWFTMTTLFNGKVLAAAGYSYKTYDLASAELYDPATGTWSSTGSLRNARFSHTATLLRDGRVLVAGVIMAILA
jgi:hypothetical protein